MLEPFEFKLDVYGDAIFAPYKYLLSFLGAGVTPDYAELERKWATLL